MILYCCAVFDSAIGSYGRPFFAPARGAATRSFVDEVNRKAPDNTLSAHPDDFELFMLFELDDVTGLVVSNKPEMLIRGKDVQTS